MLPSLLINPLHYISTYITHRGSLKQTLHCKVVSQLVDCGHTGPSDMAVDKEHLAVLSWPQVVIS